MKCAACVLAGAVVVLPAGLASADLVFGDFIAGFAGDLGGTAGPFDLSGSPQYGDVVLLAHIQTPGTTDNGLTITDLSFNNLNEPIGGEWSYTGPGVVDYLVISHSDRDHAIYRYTDANTNNMRNMGIWDTYTSGFMGMEHITAYQLVPEPGSLALLGLGGLALTRRRR